MGNEISAGRAVHQRSSHEAGAQATAAKRPRTALATGKLATGLQQASGPASFKQVIAGVGSHVHVLGNLSTSDAVSLLVACSKDRFLREKYPIEQLIFMTKNRNRRFPPPAVEDLKVNLMLLGQAHPDKSMSRYALGLIVELAELNTRLRTEAFFSRQAELSPADLKHLLNINSRSSANSVLNRLEECAQETLELLELKDRPGSEAIPRDRLGELALATLEHLNDGNIDHINVNTQMNPWQLREVIGLLSNLPASHLERTKIDRFVDYLRTERRRMLGIGGAPGG